MQVYQVPYNYEHEEKIFGGYISLRQAIYLILAICSMGLFFVPNINISVKITFALLVTSICLTFAFAKTEGAYADRYFIYVCKYIFKKKDRRHFYKNHNSFNVCFYRI